MVLTDQVQCTDLSLSLKSNLSASPRKSLRNEFQNYTVDSEELIENWIVYIEWIDTAIITGRLPNLCVFAHV